MTTKHTPGPWYTGEPFEAFPGAGLRFHISQAEGAPYTPHYSDVAQFVAETISSEKLAIQQANAWLIAAAPDLLEALIAMEQEKSDYMTRNALGDPSVETTNKMARAAIAKAKGEQQ
ncbi:hypothetical protein [Achromobacter insolitus]|uniref:hypothetical protein n=1 Tax=Achromobacter insolitus TaxID=217204 RepID=UPI002FE2C8EC